MEPAHPYGHLCIAASGVGMKTLAEQARPGAVAVAHKDVWPELPRMVSALRFRRYSKALSFRLLVNISEKLKPNSF